MVNNGEDKARFLPLRLSDLQRRCSICGGYSRSSGAAGRRTARARCWAPGAASSLSIPSPPSRCRPRLYKRADQHDPDDVPDAVATVGLLRIATEIIRNPGLVCVPSLYNDLYMVFQFKKFQHGPELIRMRNAPVLICKIDAPVLKLMNLVGRWYLQQQHIRGCLDEEEENWGHLDEDRGLQHH